MGFENRATARRQTARSRWRHAAWIAALWVLLAAPSSATAATAVPACGWAVKADEDIINIAFPDANATYWFATVPAVPGARLAIDGRYPSARYFSFHAYDAAQRPVDWIADHEIAPDEGAGNPFSDPSASAGGRYEAAVEWAERPARPQPNTLYAGETASEGVPNPASIVIYRVYVPDDPASITGGVPLPRLTLETAGGAVALQFDQCDLPAAPIGDGPSELVRDASFPDAVPRVIPGLTATNPPTAERSYGADRLVLNRLPSTPVTDAVPRQTTGSFLASQHNAYVLTRLSRAFGDVVVVQFKAPTFPDNRAGDRVAGGRHQLRYWSLCQNDAFSQRYVACMADHQAVRGPSGQVTFVVSDPADRPANATAQHGVNWLPWGGLYYSGILIYRNMMPSADFAQAVQRVPEGTPAADVMGEYLPRAAYCAKADFERTGAACTQQASSSASASATPATGLTPQLPTSGLLESTLPITPVLGGLTGLRR